MNMEEKLSKAISDRIGEANLEKLKKSKVMIFGVGGLGSNVAISLARTFVGSLVFIDFDKVDLSNMNRQQYFLEQIGKYKVEALKEEIEKINPFIQITTYKDKVTSENIDFFLELAKKEEAIVIEAFDNPKSKVLLFETLATEYREVRSVFGTGMAGYGSSNLIKTKKFSDKLYICGDEVSDVEKVGTLFASRVMICAGHQGNKVIELILESDS